MKKEMKKFVWASALLLAVCSVNSYAETHSPQPATQEQTQKTCSPTFMYENQMEWEQTADKGVTRQIVGYNGQVMMVKVKFEKGASGAAHAHYHTQVTYVASGKFEFTIGGKTQVVSAGDALYMEPDVKHGCKCLEAGVLIDCFSPMRDTFLKK